MGQILSCLLKRITTCILGTCFRTCREIDHPNLPDLLLQFCMGSSVPGGSDIILRPQARQHLFQDNGPGRRPPGSCLPGGRHVLYDNRSAMVQACGGRVHRVEFSFLFAAWGVGGLGRDAVRQAAIPSEL